MADSPATPTTHKTPAEIIAEGKAGDAPELKTKKFKLSVTLPFQNVIDFLRKQLKLEPSQSLCLFINRTFQPSPDQLVEDLVKCFLVSGMIIVNYSHNPAWYKRHVSFTNDNLRG